MPSDPKRTPFHLAPDLEDRVECCGAMRYMDATRTYCSKCDRVLFDLNDGTAFESVLYACPDCGGNGYDGGIDDMNCETCEGKGVVEG